MFIAMLMYHAVIACSNVMQDYKLFLLILLWNMEIFHGSVFSGIFLGTLS